MTIAVNRYCGDEIMMELLKKGGSKLTIFEVYGLFYGCIAATNMVKPSQYITMIFGENEISAETFEEAEEIFSNLMSLWNILAQWKPETEPFIIPVQYYPDFYSGLKQRVKDNSSLLKYFIKGLDIGETDESDFSEEGLKALGSLSGVDAFFLKYAELLEMENEEENKELEKTSNLINQLEGVMADCIARINLGLKEARIRLAEELRGLAVAQEKTYQTKRTKIQRNDPCPCGSGKKYKKCCGLKH